jgi:hypothetical protein
MIELKLQCGSRFTVVHEITIDLPLDHHRQLTTRCPICGHQLGRKGDVVGRKGDVVGRKGDVVRFLG